MDTETAFVHLARLIGEQKTDEAFALVRREIPRIIQARPDLSGPAQRAAGLANARSVTRAFIKDRPVDKDTRLGLLRVDADPQLDIVPIWPDEVKDSLQSIMVERSRLAELGAAGLHPTRTLLFVGAPGVGKTLAARWLAAQLKLPLMTLDLSSVMSSYLGRTGANIRAVLDYAASENGVLLLDEFDAIAKRRDDSGDVGELKRLVTVLLQSIDDWPPGSLLIAATNHPELLDPAAWRRFERVVRFPEANAVFARKVIEQLLGDSVESWVPEAAALVFNGSAFADIVREITVARRNAIAHEQDLSLAVIHQLSSHLSNMPKSRKLVVAKALASSGLSQRTLSQITQISRDTLRTRGIATADSKPKRLTRP